MKRYLFTPATLALLILAVPSDRPFSQEQLASPAAGFLQVECPGGSDTRVSAPFHRLPRWRGALVSAPTAVGAGVFRLGFVLPPEIAGNTLVSAPHWLFCREASVAEGLHFSVVAQAANSIDIEAEASELVGLLPGAEFEIVPAWTLETLFPPDDQTSLHLSVGRLATGRGSELLFFNGESEGIRLAPSRRFFLTSDGWFEVGSYAPAGGVVVPPGSPFLIRHPAGSAPTVFTVMQQVYSSPVQLRIRVTGGKGQDNALAPLRPVPITLSDLDLSAAQFEDSTGEDPGIRRDELHVYDNSVAEINKTASAVYFRVGGQWVEDTPGFPNADAVEIEPSSGIFLRKAEGTGSFTISWSHLPAYDPSAP